VVSEWYTGPVTPKIAVYRPVYREKVNPEPNEERYFFFPVTTPGRSSQDQSQINTGTAMRIKGEAPVGPA
jgi:hypothetical protein